MTTTTSTTSTTPAPIVALDPAIAEALGDIRGHAAACGRLDCGHLGRGPQRAVRRAVILYQAEGMGIVVDLTREAAEVAAVVGVLRESQHGRTTYVRGTLASGNRGYVAVAAGLTAVLPNAWTIRMTPQRLTVFGEMVKGYSANEIATRTHRTLETVKSHAGWLRRDTGAHDSTSALLALILAGRLSDRAMTVPESVATPAPSGE